MREELGLTERPRAASTALWKAWSWKGYSEKRVGREVDDGGRGSTGGGLGGSGGKLNVITEGWLIKETLISREDNQAENNGSVFGEMVIVLKAFWWAVGWLASWREMAVSTSELVVRLQRLPESPEGPVNLWVDVKYSLSNYFWARKHKNRTPEHKGDISQMRIL